LTGDMLTWLVGLWRYLGVEGPRVAIFLVARGVGSWGEAGLTAYLPIFLEASCEW
jgi:hypothetical protein